MSSLFLVLSIITTCLGQQFVVHRILKMRGEPYPSTSAPRAIPHVQETLLAGGLTDNSGNHNTCPTVLGGLLEMDLLHHSVGR